MKQDQGLAPVRGAHRFDEAALIDHLSQNLPGFHQPVLISQFTGGQSNPTFRISAAGKHYVLRKKPPGKLIPHAHAIEREWRVLNALRESVVPVPRVLHFYAHDDLIGTPFYVMEYLPGRVLRNPLLPDMQPGERKAHYDAMNDTLARLHTLDWQTAGLADYGKPENYIARQIALWSRQYQASKTSHVPAMERLMEWLPCNIPADDSVAIVHGDFRIENLLFHETEPRVIAVLDWELSTLGHPLSDLAFNCMTYHLSGESPVATGFLGSDLVALGIPSEREYLAAYCQRTHRDGIAEWNFYMAFSLFRTAAIQQGIHARALQGNASSETAHLFGKMFATVAEQGQALLADVS